MALAIAAEMVRAAPASTDFDNVRASFDQFRRRTLDSAKEANVWPKSRRPEMANFGQHLTNVGRTLRRARRNHSKNASASILRAFVQVLSNAQAGGEQIGEEFSSKSSPTPAALARQGEACYAAPGPPGPRKFDMVRLFIVGGTQILEMGYEAWD